MSQLETLELTAGEYSLLQNCSMHLLAKRVYRWLYQNTPDGPEKPPEISLLYAHLEATEAALLKVCKYFLMISAQDYRTMHVDDQINMFYHKCLETMRWNIQTAQQVANPLRVVPAEDPF